MNGGLEVTNIEMFLKRPNQEAEHLKIRSEKSGALLTRYGQVPDYLNSKLLALNS